MTKGHVSIGAILYNGFEMLDLFGPLEMFSLLPADHVTIHMIAEQAGPMHSALGTQLTGPKAVADFGFADAPDLDMLLLPGGFGTLPELENPKMLNFLSERSKTAQITASVCTGSALLAKAGVLDGHKATSNKQLFALATTQSDEVEWVESARWVDDGLVVTASGISAGIEMALSIIKRLWDEATARRVASVAEYTWDHEAENDPFASELNKMAGEIGLG